MDQAPARCPPQKLRPGWAGGRPGVVSPQFIRRDSDAFPGRSRMDPGSGWAIVILEER